MSKRGEWIGDGSLTGGERSDLPAHIIPPEAMLKADNVIYSKSGRLSKRGPVQPYLLSPKNDTIFQLAQYQFNNYSAPFRGFALGQNSSSQNRWYTWDLVNPPTVNRAGALNTGVQFVGGNSDQNDSFGFGAPTGITPPAFNYLGLPFFPSGPSFQDAFFAFAGKNNWTGQPNVSPVATGTVTVNAGDPLIDIDTVLPTGQTSDYPGNFIYIYLPNATAANRKLYVGVITAAQSAGSSVAVIVYPTPQISISGSCYVGVSPYASGPILSRKTAISELYLNNAFPPVGGDPISLPQKVFTACTHQNRIVCAPAEIQKITSLSASILPDPSLTEKAVIVWSAISGEPATASNTNADGILPLQISGWPGNQSVTLETAGIVSLVSMDANNLMVLCQDKTLMLSGSLGTIIPAGGVNTSSFNIRTVSQKVGCINNLSVQRTPVGVMFASRDGVYVTDGSDFQNTMEGKIQIKWNEYVDSILASSSPITGSALIGDTHYVLFTHGQNFICDLYNDFSWSTMTVGSGYAGSTQKVSYGYGIQDYRGRSEVYAPKVTSSYDSTTYCDKIVLVDSILLTDGNINTSVPSSGATVNGQFAYSVDAGSADPINAELWTRSFTFGDPSSLKTYKTMTATYLADAKVNSSDPLNTYVAEGLEPTTSTTTPYNTVAASPSGNTAPFRVSLIPRVIDNGVSFGFKTNYVRSDSPASGPFSSKCRFALYEIALNFSNLRRGRTKQ